MADPLPNLKAAQVISVANGRDGTRSSPATVLPQANRPAHSQTQRIADAEDLDELDNLVAARDRLELYNMLALEKDIAIDKSCHRESAIGRIYPAKWLGAQVDVACLEIDPEHLHTRKHALGGLINTALSLRKLVKINHKFANNPGSGAHKTSQQRSAEELRYLSETSSGQHQQRAGEQSSVFRAHIQELVAVQLEPHLTIITSSVHNCPSLHAMIQAGHGTWSWSERTQMLLQISQAMSELHSNAVFHGNLRLANIHYNPVQKRVIICGTGWDRLLPYDILNIHQADNPGSVRWTAPECYLYISSTSSQTSSSANRTKPATTSNLGSSGAARINSPQAAQKRQPHPPGHRPSCDVYAFAITMWELANGTGELPFSHLRFTREVTAHVQANNRMFLLPAWPSDLRELIRMCWTGDGAKRPAFGMISQTLASVMVQNHGKKHSRR